MMTLPDPGVLNQLIRERQTKLRMAQQQAEAPGAARLRVRIGHALIVAGVTLSGERIEQPGRRSALPGAA